MHDLSTTLVAVATPAGRGGLGCLRLSGPESVEIARKLFCGAGRSKSWQPGQTHFGKFLGRAGQPIDHGYAVSFAEGRSFTGDRTVEFWTHGSPPILDELLAAAVAQGAQLAGPGEFTYRALRNGRIDLTRAEAIRDLIEARTVYQARLAYSQAEGALARRLQPVREELEEWIARAEAAVEFVDESETHLDPVAFRREMGRLADRCRELLAGFTLGKVVREGVQLAIVGQPNVGKSSLFNRLLSDERAIVTESPGTTRDLLEETIDLNGIPVRLVDTAGLRETADPVEGEGIRRARQAAAESHWILHVIDGGALIDKNKGKIDDAVVAQTILSASEMMPTNMSARTITVLNKSDLLEPLPPLESAVWVSAQTGAGIDVLRKRLHKALTHGQGDEVATAHQDPLLTNRRHAVALEKAVAAMEQAMTTLDSGDTEEWALLDLRIAMAALAELTGVWDVDDLYDRIFSTFCIGK